MFFSQGFWTNGTPVQWMRAGYIVRRSTATSSAGTTGPPVSPASTRALTVKSLPQCREGVSSIPPAGKEDELIAVLEDLLRGSLRPHNGVAIFGSGNQGQKEPGSSAGLRTRPTQLVGRPVLTMEPDRVSRKRAGFRCRGFHQPTSVPTRHRTARTKDPPHPAGRVRASLPFIPSTSLVGRSNSHKLFSSTDRCPEH
jgi:hypothetical protein